MVTKRALAIIGSQHLLNKGEKTMNYKYYTTAALLLVESGLDYYDPELVEEICDRAGLSEEYKSSDEDTFEHIIDRAIDILKENI